VQGNNVADVESEERMRDTIDMAREAGLFTHKEVQAELKAFEALVRADERRLEREACANKTEEFARKWWKIHCDSNLHYSSTLRAHQDFCALQAAIRARGETK
jgi:hypothetical protein